MRSILILIFSFICTASFAQADSLFKKEVYISPKGDTMHYRLMYPKNYDPSQKYPLVLFLHGVGERGSDNEKQLNYVADLFLNEEHRDSFPSFVLIPQCPINSYWANINAEQVDGKRVFKFDVSQDPTSAMTSLVNLVAQTTTNYNIETKKVYVMGLSMGGMGTFEIVYRLPKMFAAAVAICGGGDPKSAPLLTQPKWRIYHGDLDDVVPDSLSKQMQEAITKAGGQSELTIYEGVNHGSWFNVFAEPDLLKWLFSQEKK